MGNKTSKYIVVTDTKNEFKVTDLNGNIVLHIQSDKYSGYYIENDTLFFSMYAGKDISYSGYDFYDTFKFENNEQIFVKKERW